MSLVGKLRSRSMDRRLRRSLFIMVGLAPALIWFWYFAAYPLLMAFVKSFHDWNLVYETDSFVGLENYIRMASDRVFLISLKNTIYGVLYIVPASVLLGLIVAVALNSFSEGICNVFTTIYFLPVVTSVVAMAAVWKWLYHPGYGLFNYILSLFGIPPQPFLNSPEQALPAVSIVAIWQNIGFLAVIFLAALRGIPETVYEAAKIDGATGPAVFRHITVPLLAPAILFNTVMTVISAFQIFIPIQVMTDGGPGSSTMVLALYIYQKGINHLEMGYASAIAWILFGIIMVVTVLQWRFIRADWEY